LLNRKLTVVYDAVKLVEMVVNNGRFQLCLYIYYN